MTFFSLFQLDFKKTRLKFPKIVELRQDQIYQKLLGCLFIIVSIVIVTAFQQSGWELLALIVFPVFFLPGLALAVMSPIVTLDFSKGQLALTIQLLWLTVMNWSAESLSSRNITVFKVRKVIVTPWSSGERWHFKIEISKDNCKFVFFTTHHEPLEIIKKFVGLINSEHRK